MMQGKAVMVCGTSSGAGKSFLTTALARCGAASLIVCDIDRGGAFAHLYGTVELLPAGQRALVRAFVLNKWRVRITARRKMISRVPEQ